MRAPDSRNAPIPFVDPTQLFQELGGYYEMGNQDLAGSLERWELLEDANRNNPERARNFLRWSITASFLHLANALQWFVAGLLLERASYLPAQTMQQEYYSIFFSYGSFLALHGKGHFTVRTDVVGDDIRPRRRDLWFDQGALPSVKIREKGEGGEHELRAHWFYEAFRSWEERDRYPAVLMFVDDRAYHTGFRNLFTYSLSQMAEELHHNSSTGPVSSEILLRLWKGDRELPDYFPEEFWALEHLRPSLDMHSRLISDFRGGDPLTRVQKYIIRQLIQRHEADGMDNLLREILGPMVRRT